MEKMKNRRRKRMAIPDLFLEKDDFKRTSGDSRENIPWFEY